MDIIFVSHCLLNTASKVARPECAGAAEESLRREVIGEAVSSGTQIVQLPCPEFAVFGPKRWGHVYDQFDTIAYRRACRDLLARPIADLIEHQRSGRAVVRGVIGVDGSPTCGVSFTCRADWGGEISYAIDRGMPKARSAEGSGVMIEELCAMLSEHGLEVPIVGLDPRAPERALALARGSA